MNVTKDIDRYINELELDLSGLKIFTEAATGLYRLNPVAAKIAGADEVYAYDKHNSIGNTVFLEMNSVGVLWDKYTDAVSQADIITNSGYVRPIDKMFIVLMKPTAVISLMFEPWEFKHRPQDIDLYEASKKKILVMGTNERKVPVEFYLKLTVLFLLFMTSHKIIPLPFSFNSQRWILALFLAGLKVGELMARCRLAGLGIRETMEECLKNELVLGLDEWRI